MVLRTPNFRKLLKNHGVYVSLDSVEHTGYDPRTGKPSTTVETQIVRAYFTFYPLSATISSVDVVQKEGLVYLDVFDVSSFPTIEPNKITAVTYLGRKYNVEFGDPIMSGSRVLCYKLWVKA
jgi:hypothetical protein